MMKSALTAVLFSLVIVSGCGGSSGGSDGATSTGYTSAKQVSTALKCTYYTGNFDEAGATNAGLCAYAGDNVVVAWFKSAKLAKSFPDIAAQAGGKTTFLYGSNWAVICSIRSACESARKVLGGKIG
jgi:hypothetical protein